MAEKHLTEGAWKTFAKGRNLKDAALLKALADWSRAESGAADAQLGCLEAIDKQAQALLKAQKADKDLAAYLSELDKALARARKAAEQAAKERSKLAASAEEGEDDDSPALLTTKMLPLLRLVQKGEMMHTLVAKSGKQVVVMLSRKAIPPARRKMLADQLGGGSTKYYPGYCSLEAGAATFVLKAEVAGLSKLVKRALLDQTGLRVNKVKCRGEDGDDDDHDDDEPGEGAASAPGAGDTGPALAGLSKSRLEWGRARAHAVGELTRLKQILQDEYRDAADEQAPLAAALQRVDATIAAIDEELTDRLDQVINAEPAQRAEVAAAAKAALSRIVDLVDRDQILQSIDGNELAPDMVVVEPLRARLKDISATLS